jgi:hypothetical protein
MRAKHQGLRLTSSFQFADPILKGAESSGIRGVLTGSTALGSIGCTPFESLGYTVKQTVCYVL